MVIEAVEKLADRYGSSIQAVRKYLTNNFPLKQQQTASFNSLTLKALSKAVALEVLEYDKRLYRISTKEKERRKEKDKALRAAASAASRDALATVSDKICEYFKCACGFHAGVVGLISCLTCNFDRSATRKALPATGEAAAP